jgi:hypothetical protein
VIQTLPRVKPTRGAPSFLNILVYYDSDILSSMDSVKRKAQVRAWATRPTMKSLNGALVCSALEIECRT